MRKKALFSFVVSLVLLAGCLPSEPELPSNPLPPDPVEEKIKTMTLDEKIGQMVIAGIEGQTAGENTNALIQQYRVGGIILFSKNLKNADQSLQLINSLKEINSVNSIPLFISVDEEGGRVSRLPHEIKKMPASQYIGRQNNPQLAYKVGETLAKQLKAFGFNMNFAPVLDINSNPNNPVIGDRSFGNTAEIVKEMGINEMKGMQDQKIIPVAKHFPGHGDTSTDSHIGLPVENKSLERLHDFELIPFKEAIQQGADAIMVAHILLPQIDPDYPSSMSKKILTDLLRKELGFNGVIMTDDMTMGAISTNYDLKEAAITSILAGTDILLVCHQMNNVTDVINGIKEAVQNSTITEERINESVYRILKLKDKYNLSNDKIDSVDINELNQMAENLF